MSTPFASFDQGMILHDSECTPAASLNWNKHPTFAGVFLKNLLTGEASGGALSCHLVRIEPHMAIGRHTHPDSLELHEVMAGSGTCMTPDGPLAYVPGTISLIARDMPHAVHAGENGLYLFAKFVVLKA
ncbi:MAG: cupin domain-containing protein [Proteobacteria bacterium]|nr:cupin domain-containing protein [Pseudomonadota bacterium]